MFRLPHPIPGTDRVPTNRADTRCLAQIAEGVGSHHPLPTGPDLKQPIEATVKHRVSRPVARPRALIAPHGPPTRTACGGPAGPRLIPIVYYIDHRWYSTVSRRETHCCPRSCTLFPKKSASRREAHYSRSKISSDRPNVRGDTHRLAHPELQQIQNLQPPA